MQEVEGFLNGSLDYSKLRGDTGPLVYPAGFVYIYSLLYYVTNHGTNVRLAQYIFAGLHIVLLLLVFRLYAKARKVPPYALLIICCTSYRIHSIFVLRLFNDPVAMLIFYASLNAFIDSNWYAGSILYSLAVSVKMNVLLYAPALFIHYISSLSIVDVIKQLSVCAAVQLLLGFPFLIANPLAYLRGSFDLARVFEYKWTVNWRFLPEEIFLNRYFHILLLILHILLVVYFSRHWLTCSKAWNNLKILETDLKPQLQQHKKELNMSAMTQLFILPMFMCNFIGMVVSRSLHYQFYVWYYHTLPYLAWATDYNVVTKFFILGLIEISWNTYPSTVFSSLNLHVCHAALLYGLYKRIPSTKKSKLNKD